MDQDRKHAPSKWTLATRILAERRAILERLAGLDQYSPGRHPGRHGSSDTPTSEVMEAAQESVAKEIEFASREILVARLKGLARAEEKIREGTYGRCDACGHPIAPARLQAMPEAVRCMPCAAQSERHLSQPYTASATGPKAGCRR